MAKASDLTDWGFVPPAMHSEQEPRRRRSPFTVVDESGREITAAEAVDDGEVSALRPPREPLLWGLISLGVLTVAGFIVAIAAAWTRPPALANTPALELAPRSNEGSEIWTQDAVAFDALARARSALQPAPETSSSPIPEASASPTPEARPSSTPDDAKLEPGISPSSTTNQAAEEPGSEHPPATSPIDSDDPSSDNPY
jgi:hypothetical protein